MNIKELSIILITITFVSCVTKETNQEISLPKVKNYPNYAGEKHKVSIGNFSNKSRYQTGLFGSDIDYLGKQAKNILKTHLQQTNRFILLDRENLEESKRENQFSKVKENIKGAKFVISGAVTAFGRKTIGNHQLFGVLGKGKKQVAYCKANINVLNPRTSEIIYSIQGAGEYALSSQEIIGFGTSSGYDSTLNGRVLDLAIRSAVNKLIEALHTGNLTLN